MPILPLDRTGSFAATLGIMLYPGDDDESQRCARAYASQFLAKPIEMYLEDGRTLSFHDLAQFHADCGVHLHDIDTRSRQALATGHVFHKYFELAKTHPTLASWENAEHAFRAEAATLGLSASRSQLKQARKHYRSVTHLWGAWCMRGQGLWPKPSVGYEAWHDFEFFLMEAEILLRWGRSWRPRRAKANPPLSGEAWRVPEGWKPPEEQPGWPRTRLVRTIPNEVLARLGRPGRPRKAA